MPGRISRSLCGNRRLPGQCGHAFLASWMLADTLELVQLMAGRVTYAAFSRSTGPCRFGRRCRLCRGFPRDVPCDRWESVEAFDDVIEPGLKAPPVVIVSSVSSRAATSWRASMNEDVMTAVRMLRDAIASSMTTAPTSRPAGAVGVTSP